MPVASACKVSSQDKKRVLLLWTLNKAYVCRYDIISSPAFIIMSRMCYATLIWVHCVPFLLTILHTHTHTQTMCCVGVWEHFVTLQLSLTSTHSQIQTQSPSSYNFTHAHVCAELCVQNTIEESSVLMMYTVLNTGIFPSVHRSINDSC